MENALPWKDDLPVAESLFLEGSALLQKRVLGGAVSVDVKSGENQGTFGQEAGKD